VAGGDGRKWQRSAGRGRKMKLTARAQLIERRERGGQLRRREPKGKMYFREDATDARAMWAGQGGFGLQSEVGAADLEARD
jgi:hypothetical protein